MPDKSPWSERVEELNHAVRCLAEAGRHADALPMAHEAEAISRAHLTDADAEYTTARHQLLMACVVLNLTEEARRLLDQVIADCCASFAEMDYARTIRITFDFQTFGPPFLPLRLLLISWLRLRDPDLQPHLEGMVRNCLEAVQRSNWDLTLVRFLLGEPEAENGLACAASDTEKCQAHYYRGSRCFTRGQYADAATHLGRCAASSDDCFERRLAVAELPHVHAAARAATKVHGPSAAFDADAGDVLEKRRQLIHHAQEALSLYDRGRLFDALALMAQVREGTGQIVGTSHPDYATCSHNLGLMLRAAGRLDEAAAVTEEAVNSRIALQGPNGPLVAESLDQLGDLRRQLGDHQTAEALLLRAAEIARPMGGARYATVLNNLGLLHRVTGRYAEGERSYREAYAVYVAAYGKAHPYSCQVLNNLGELLSLRGRFEEAEEALSAALWMRRDMLGSDHPHVCLSLTNLASLFVNMGRYQEAKPLLERAVESTQKALGPIHPQYATALNNLADYHMSRGDYRAAEPLLIEAERVRGLATGERGEDYGVNLNNLAMLYSGLGRPALAISYVRRALEVSRQAVGEQHPTYARCLINNAALLREQGDGRGAQSMMAQAEQILRDSLGPEHPEYASCLHTSATLWESSGAYAQAIADEQRSLDIRRRVLGPYHPDVGNSLSTLGALFLSTGAVARAAGILKDAAGIYRSSLGKRSDGYLATLQNQAVLCIHLGDEEGARQLFGEVLQICSTGMTDVHPRVAHCLTMIARMAGRARQFDSADRLFRTAADICRRAFGENHSSFADVLAEWAELPVAQGDYGRAEDLVTQTLKVRQATVGREHPFYASALYSLAVLRRHRGEFGAAEALHRDAAALRAICLGEQHLGYGNSLAGIAACAAAGGRPIEALELIQQAVRVGDGAIGDAFGAGSEGQRLSFLADVQHDLHLFLSLVYRFFLDSEPAVQDAFDAVLRRKAIAAEPLAAQREAVLTGSHEVLRPRLQELSTLRSEIARKSLAGPGPEGRAEFLRVLGALNKERQELESDLAREIPEMNLERKLRGADRHTVAAALPAASALVEFFRLQLFDFEAVVAKGETMWPSTRYLAFVLVANNANSVRLVDLGDADAIDRKVEDYRLRVTADHRQDSRDLGAPPTRNIETRDASLALRSTIFDPLCGALGGHRRLLLAPDGGLARLPFETLPTDDGNLIDKYRISYVTSGRDILRFGAPLGKTSAPLVICDPDFDLSDAESFGRTDEEDRLTSGSRSAELGALWFLPLPGTRIEGLRVAEMLGIQPWVGADALEGHLKSRRSPYVLHLATHGFFLSDSRGAGHSNHDVPQAPFGWSAIRSAAAQEVRFASSWLDNPLLRSGLALAGANAWLASKALPDAAEDGLLTAEDVGGLDLVHTRLVVLSACDTGLGAITSGEGVFGLRRAFVEAGARTLIMSLWKVPDSQTQELMEDLYRYLLEGSSPHEALRQAQLAIRARFPSPYYWGAFICQGDPLPIELLAN